MFEAQHFLLRRGPGAQRYIGNISRAAQLIEKAAGSYKGVLTHLENFSYQFDDANRELRPGARRLFEAIHLATFHYVARQ